MNPEDVSVNPRTRPDAPSALPTSATEMTRGSEVLGAQASYESLSVDPPHVSRPGSGSAGERNDPGLWANLQARSQASSNLKSLHHTVRNGRLAHNKEKARAIFERGVAALRSSSLPEPERQKYYRLMTRQMMNAVERSLNARECSILEHAVNGTQPGGRGVWQLVQELRAQRGVRGAELGEKELTAEDLQALANPDTYLPPLRAAREGEKETLEVLRRYTENATRKDAPPPVVDEAGRLIFEGRYEIQALGGPLSAETKRSSAPYAKLAFLLKDTESGALVAMMSNGEAWVVRDDGVNFKHRYRAFLNAEEQQAIRQAGHPTFAEQAVYNGGDFALDALTVTNTLLPLMAFGAGKVAAARQRALQAKSQDLSGFTYVQQNASGGVTVTRNVGGNVGSYGFEPPTKVVARTRRLSGSGTLRQDLAPIHLQKKIGTPPQELLIEHADGGPTNVMKNSSARVQPGSSGALAFTNPQRALPSASPTALLREAAQKSAASAQGRDPNTLTVEPPGALAVIPTASSTGVIAQAGAQNSGTVGGQPTATAGGSASMAQKPVEMQSASPSTAAVDVSRPRAPAKERYGALTKLLRSRSIARYWRPDDPALQEIITFIRTTTTERKRIFSTKDAHVWLRVTPHAKGVRLTILSVNMKDLELADRSSHGAAFARIVAASVRGLTERAREQGDPDYRIGVWGTRVANPMIRDMLLNYGGRQTLKGRLLLKHAGAKVLKMGVHALLSFPLDPGSTVALLAAKEVAGVEGLRFLGGDFGISFPARLLLDNAPPTPATPNPQTPNTSE